MSVSYKSQKEKTTSDFKDRFSLGQKKGYFILDQGSIKYLAVGRGYNFSDPEEKTRMMYYFDLIEKYKYPADKIEFEIGVFDKTPNRYADIVVFTNDAQRKPYIVVECKRDDVSNAEFGQAVKQAIAKAWDLGALFAVCVAGDKYRVIKIGEPNNETEIDDIPIHYEEGDK